MLEDKIYEAIVSLPVVQNKLAKYNGKPAVFFQRAASDTDGGWDDPLMMFPRIVYNVFWVNDVRRKIAGELRIHIHGSDETTLPEEIMPEIISGISGLFFSEENEVYGAVWNSRRQFQSGKKTIVPITGNTLKFDIAAFPKQMGNTPSPVWAVNAFIKQYMPENFVIGIDTLPERFLPSNEKPVFYVSWKEGKNVYTTYAMAWQQSELNIHVFARTTEKTLSVIQDLLYYLSIEREALMQNGSPVLFIKINQNSRADPLFEGQIVLKTQYGLLRKEKEVPKLNNVYSELEV